jgi:uncharacterized protein YndB with AHSA1/START domain
MEQTFKAIADPTRRRILELVAEEELAAGDIWTHFAVTRPAISQHLTVLKQAGLISERRRGTSRLYRARPQGLTEPKLFLEGFWDTKLGRLQRVGEAQSGGEVTERMAVERETLIAAPPEVVWRLLTDPADMTRWMGQTAIIEPSVGGSYRVEVVPGQEAVGEFVEVDPPYRLAHTWGWLGDPTVPAGSTIVTYELVPTATGTLLHLTHRNLPSAVSAGSHSRGWGHYLPRLAALAAGELPEPDPWASEPERLAAELRPGQVD